MTQDEQKKHAAEAALEYVKNIPVFGVGTGSTVNYFIDLLSNIKAQIEGVVSSSEKTSELLKKCGIPIVDLAAVGELAIYIDGADEINSQKQLIKGGGGALTREKIIAGAAKTFVCIADVTKSVAVLGGFPLPIEVIPMARSFVARQIMKQVGGQPEWRKNFVTDNGNQVLDVHNLEIMRPIEIERTINDIPGVVSCGIFSLRPADIVLLGDEQGVKTL